MHCWSCKKALEEPSNGAIAFRATCDHCNTWLHCCHNCAYYQPGKPNDCQIPGTEQIADRTQANFCEEFKQLQKVKEQKSNTDALNALFKDKDNTNKKKSFEDLFKEGS